MILYNMNSLTEAPALTQLYHNKAVSNNKAKCAINVAHRRLRKSDLKARIEETSTTRSSRRPSRKAQAFSVSSGDSGAYECGATAGRARRYPAVSPYVMSLGGTTLYTDTTGTTWQGETGCGPFFQRLQLPVNASSSAAPARRRVADGKTLPSWQTAAGHRSAAPPSAAVPDISLDASPNSGALVPDQGLAPSRSAVPRLAAPLFGPASWSAHPGRPRQHAAPFPAQTLYQERRRESGLVP